jgi:hypothetical protein
VRENSAVHDAVFLVHQLLTLALSTVSAAVQAAGLLTSQHNQSRESLGTLEMLSSVAAVSDLFVVGLSVARSAMDLMSLLKYLWRLRVRSLEKGEERSAGADFSSLPLLLHVDTAVDEHAVTPTHSLRSQQSFSLDPSVDEIMLTEIMLANCFDCDAGVSAATNDVEHRFWDADGNAKVGAVAHVSDSNDSPLGLRRRKGSLQPAGFWGPEGCIDRIGTSPGNV